MGGWYQVVKTIKGNHYWYLQQTYREGGRVHTRNRYLGRVAEGSSGGRAASAPARPAQTSASLFQSPADFGAALLTQFDAPAWGRDAGEQLMGSSPVTTRASGGKGTQGAHTDSTPKTSRTEHAGGRIREGEHVAALFSKGAIRAIGVLHNVTPHNGTKLRKHLYVAYTDIGKEFYCTITKRAYLEALHLFAVPTLTEAKFAQTIPF